MVVLENPSRLNVAENGDAATYSLATEATARTFLPEEPELGKNVPAAPELPAEMVTTTPSSTRREAISAHALVDQPFVPPILAVMISTCLFQRLCLREVPESHLLHHYRQ